MRNKTKILILLAIVTMAFLGYFFPSLKTRYVINNYFNQGRWEELRKEYQQLERENISFVFFGDSMTENFRSSMTNNDSTVNMGISGDFTKGLIMRIDNIIDFQPKKVFIMIGINDIIEKVPLPEIQSNYLKILDLIEQNCLSTEIYIESTLPTYGRTGFFSSSTGINKTVQELNLFLKKTAKEKDVVFIDMYSDFTNDNNELHPELTTDGVHLNKKGYRVWESHLKRSIH